jgi:hypothetical protein
MAISYDKKIMECVLRSVISEGNVAQGKAIKSICKSPKPLFITGKGGSGKAQPLYAKILTPEGFKNMGDIKVGDKVMGADGIPKTVKTSDQVVINFYKRTLGNGGIVKPVPMEELEKSMINLSTGSEIDFAEFNL